MLEINKIYCGDCLEVMKEIDAKSIDCIITDPPYGTTACKWDSVIPFEPMWEQLNRIIKPNGAVVLFGSEPFSSALRMSNIKNYKYDWYWNKRKSGNPLLSKIQPQKIIEIISVFNVHNFYPIKTKRNKPHSSGNGLNAIQNCGIGKGYNKTYYDKYPTVLLDFSNAANKGKVHSTQKPVALVEYLIKTYTLENETVLDFTIGSGTTAIACLKIGRNFIGIEKEQKYCEITRKRIEKLYEKYGMILDKNRI